MEPHLKERYRFPSGHEGALWYHDASEYRHPRHRHSGIEVNLVLAGTGVYLVSDRVVRTSRRSAVWFFPDEDRVLLDQSSDYRMLIILFTPSLLRRAVDSKTADQTFRTSSPTRSTAGSSPRTGRASLWRTARCSSAIRANTC